MPNTVHALSPRTNSRNGYRHRDFDTRAGILWTSPSSPKVRQGSYFPDWLFERRRRAEAALTIVTATCFLLVIGHYRLSKSQVCVMAKDLDEQVLQFRARPLHAGPR